MSDTNHFEIEGKFLRIDTREGKGGKVFETLVIEVDGKYQQFVPFRLWGHSANTAKTLHQGDVLRIKGKLGGREWQGKVYGENSADSIEVVGQRELPTGNPPAPGDDDSDTIF